MEIWIGLFNVIPNKNNNLLSKEALGAYVNILGLAKNEKAFVKNVLQNLKNLDFEVENFKDIDLFESRKKKAIVSKEILDLAETIEPKNPIVFDVFHSYAEM
jgi:hypothetical protein